MFVFGVNFPRNDIATTRKDCLRINFPKIITYLFVGQRITWKMFGNHFLESLISVT